MSEIEVGVRSGDESFEDLHQRACSLGVYEGAHASELPEYVQNRLKPILDCLCNLDNRGENRAVAYVELSTQRYSVDTPRETVTFQQEHGLDQSMSIEKYFYEEGFKKVDIRVMTLKTNTHVLFFESLVPFFRSRGEYEVASMGSYDMVDCVVELRSGE